MSCAMSTSLRSRRSSASVIRRGMNFSGVGSASSRSSSGGTLLEKLEEELFVDRWKLSLTGSHEELAGHGHQHTVVPGGVLDEDVLEVFGEQFWRACFLQSVT